ncbi:MAG: zf-HC2 domain-containing protein [Pyrinomonadaceae bacterium]
MTCEESQQAFSQYVDGMLTADARLSFDEHLLRCPVCRAQAAELRLVARSLSMLARPLAPADLADSISSKISIEAAARRQKQSPLPLRERVMQWLEFRLMPYTVGTFASVILFFVMFSALRLSLVTMRDWELAARHSDTISYQILYVQDGRDKGFDLTKPVSPLDYAAGREADAKKESPSLNPRGALAALTRSNMHSDSEADDMVVVADVFSDGSASLADVVHPPRDRRMLDDFQTALRQDAAFVPASYDRRPETMRVVFVVQRVDVRERKF